MRQVFQDRFGWNGNCQAACVASIFEVALADVPDSGNRQFGPALARWLLPRWLGYIEVPVGPLVRSRQDDPPMPEQVLGWQPLGYFVEMADPLVILCGPSPRGNFDHCVVGFSNGFNHRMVHDPHPEGGWVKAVTHMGLFVRLNPAPATQEDAEGR